MGLCHPAAPAVSDGAQQEDNGHGSDTDAAVTLSDTLSAATPFASPRGEVQAELSGFSGAMAPGAPDEATPGFTPPPSPHSLTAAPSRCPGRMLARRAQCPASEARCCELPPAPLSWQDVRYGKRLQRSLLPFSASFTPSLRAFTATLPTEQPQPGRVCAVGGAASVEAIARSQRRAEFLGRAAAFQRGDWLQLLQSARRVSRPAHDTPTLPPDGVAERKRHQAWRKCGKLLVLGSEIGGR
ncbi:hypothetical protein AK812_SmicGene36564 [Symbiodinium microadriaticum]|uniref:Uncharacterized protein n=1 Tax=Symbiodinium microadriaticum TaxID=2951 RepID=A0A1Q9CIK3_SYMMI|nr:hypothetical protein AK812_SmicGene36564 [Symbiodinium microadriaticum]